MSTEPTYYTLIAKRDIPELGVSAGDGVTYEPGHQTEIGLHRPLKCSREMLAAFLQCGAFKVALNQYPVNDVLSRLRGDAVPAPRAEPVPPEPIDIDAAIQELANPTEPPPVEPSAFRLLGHEGYQNFSKKRRRFLRSMPRVCRSCGGTFKGAEAATTCQSCKAARRKCCVRCGDVFTAEHTKEKRCVPCLEKAAAVGEKVAAELLRRKQETG